MTMWLSIIELEKVVQVLNMYDNSINTNYGIYHIYVQVETKGITAIQEAKGFEQVGAVQLYSLICKKSSRGRFPTKHIFLKKIYDFSQPHPKDMIEETLYIVYPVFELLMEF